MELHIEATGFELTESIRYHVEERLARTEVWEGRADFRRVDVFLTRVGTGRTRKCTCAIELSAGEGVKVRIEDQARSVWNAVDRCSKLAGGIAAEVRRRSVRGRQLSLGRLWG